MNKIITILLFGFFLIFGFVFPVSAQSTEKLVIVEYKDTKELNELFPFSQRVLAYLNGENFETGIFLALVTDQDIESITEKNYSLEILDESPDIDRYVLLYHPLKDKASLLRELGEVNSVTPHHTLLKLDEGKEFTHEGVGVEFFENPFLEGITPPPNATPVLPETTNNSEKSDQTNTGILLIAIVLTLVLGVGLGVYLYLKKKKESASSF